MGIDRAVLKSCIVEHAKTVNVAPTYRACKQNGWANRQWASFQNRAREAALTAAQKM